MPLRYATLAENDSVTDGLSTLVNAWGRVLIGTFVALILYGLTFAQAVRYFRSYPGDRLVLKGLVLATLLLETVHMGLCCHLSYYYMISTFFHPDKLDDNVISLELLAALTGILIVISQSFFARRAWMLGEEYRPWVVIALLLFVVEFGFCLAYTIVSIVGQNLAAVVNISWVIATASSCAVVADWIITVVLILALRKNRTPIKRTNNVVDTLMLYTVTTGLLTSVVMFLVAVFSIVDPSNLTFTTISIIVMKLYANSLLAALNSRQSLKGKMEATIHLTGTEMVFGVPGADCSLGDPANQPVVVELHEVSPNVNRTDIFHAKESTRH